MTPRPSASQRVKGKICIVTGAALGIGRACVRRLSEAGASIAVFDVLDDAGRTLVDELQASGRQAHYWHVNVAREAEVKAAIDGVADRYGAVDVLVNNAGIAGANKPTHEITEQEWDLVQSVNVKGVFFCTKHVIPHMRRSGAGSIINLSSIYGLVGAPDVPPYHASKGAVRLMSKTDAMCYAGDHIRVNSVHPGYVWTPLVEQQIPDTMKARGLTREQVMNDVLLAAQPTKRFVTPEEVAALALFLCRDEARSITGANLSIDGGWTAA